MDSFASAVSDNDGSAFITKTEFDVLKNDFQSQINEYNTTIDAKIDGAISDYLSGIQGSGKYMQHNIYSDMGRDILFGTVPFVSSADVKYVVNQQSNIMVQGDGYNATGIAIVCRLFSGILSESNGTGTYNVFQNVNGVNCFMGPVVDEYCECNYLYTGDVMTDKSRAATVEVPSGNGTINANVINAIDASVSGAYTYSWGNASDLKEWSKSQPNTGGWGTKYLYWMRADGYHMGTINNCENIVSSSTVSVNTTDMIDYDDRNPKTNPKTKNTNWTASDIVMSQGCYVPGTTQIFTILYWEPKTISLNQQNLYSYAAATSLGRDIRLWGGMPLFVASKTGKATLQFILNTTNSSATNVTFAMKDNKAFDNISIATEPSLIKFNAWQVLSSGGMTSLGTNLTTLNVARGTEVRIEFDVLKSHEYFFKLLPSSLGGGASPYYYGYIEKFTNDIYIEQE